MTTFILSHNLQVQSEVVPAFDLNALSDGLKKHSQHIENVGVTMTLVNTLTYSRVSIVTTPDKHLRLNVFMRIHNYT